MRQLRALRATQDRMHLRPRVVLKWVCLAGTHRKPPSFRGPLIAHTQMGEEQDNAQFGIQDMALTAVNFTRKSKVQVKQPCKIKCISAGKTWTFTTCQDFLSCGTRFGLETLWPRFVRIPPVLPPAWSSCKSSSQSRHPQPSRMLDETLLSYGWRSGQDDWEPHTCFWTPILPFGFMGSKNRPGFGKSRALKGCFSWYVPSRTTSDIDFRNLRGTCKEVRDISRDISSILALPNQGVVLFLFSGARNRRSRNA